MTTRIDLAGVTRVGKTGQHFVIRAGKPFAENSLENPRLIVPQEVKLENCASQFQVTLPPFSVNVLRISAAK